MVSMVAPPRARIDGTSMSFHFSERVEEEAFEAGEPSALASGMRAQRTWGAPMMVTSLMRRSRSRRERRILESSELKEGVEMR